METKKLFELWKTKGGEMGELIIKFSENNTSELGLIDSWSPFFKSSITQMLLSPLPTILVWGPNLITFYNDVAITIFETRHPQALGKPFGESKNFNILNYLPELFCGYYLLI